MKTGKGVNGGVSGWKKRARTEHSRRRRRRRPMKKSLVAPAGLANILLSNTGATHTHPHSVHPSRNHYTVPFLSRGVANGGGKEETRGEETGRKSVGERGNSRERGRGVARWKRPEIFSSPLSSPPRWCRMHRRSKELSFATSVTDVVSDMLFFSFCFFFFFFFGARNKLKFDPQVSLSCLSVILELYFEVCMYI